MVSPDVVVLPAASLEAASAGKQPESGPDADLQRTEPGRAVAKGSTGARAFKRVNDDEWLGKKGAWDNSYEAKFGSSGWGAKASQTLLQVSQALPPPVEPLSMPGCGSLTVAKFASSMSTVLVRVGSCITPAACFP